MCCSVIMPYLLCSLTVKGCASDDCSKCGAGNVIEDVDGSEECAAYTANCAYRESYR